MLIVARSDLTGKISSMDIDVTQEQINEWEGGSLIQDVMPDLTPEEREFIMTGITQEEWESKWE
jgi:hypothetical protein